MWRADSSGTPTPASQISIPSRDEFVGANACASCHLQQFEQWKRSTHGRAGGFPGQIEVIARFDGRPLHFANAVVTPQRVGSDYSFAVEETGRPRQVFAVDAVVGGGHMTGGGTQAFFTRSSDGTYRFLPFDFIRKENLWFCNARTSTKEGLTPITPALSLHDCADWPPWRVLGDSEDHDNCQSCHGSQIELGRDREHAAWHTQIGSLTIDCEACHGPGRTHLARVADPAAIKTGDLGYRTLDTLDKDASLGVCFQCHALKTTIKAGYRTGADFSAFYSLLLPLLGDEPVHPDGRTKSFAYQQGHLWSDCYVNGGMTCTSCHDPHTQGYRDTQGRTLAGRFDDRQCTSCHQSKAVQPESHTHHAPGTDGARCVSCHMPYLQQPAFGNELHFARSDHTIPVPRADLDAALGITNACRGCHRDMTENQVEQQVIRWYGARKPIAKAIAAAFAVANQHDPVAAARLVLRSDEKHTAALFAGMARFVDKFIVPDQSNLDAEIQARLLALVEHPNQDVRALALAALHIADGVNPKTRQVLDVHRLKVGVAADGVRGRWAFILLFYADQAHERGMTLRSIALFERARELEPDRPRTLTSLGLAYAEGGQLPAAEGLLRRSLELDPAQPRALVVLGEILRDLHQVDQAKQAWRDALLIDAGTAIAELRLGELAFAEGDDVHSLQHCDRALSIDPNLAQAYFVKGQAHDRQGATEAARRALTAGLALDAKSDEAQRARALLQRLRPAEPRPAEP